MEERFLRQLDILKKENCSEPIFVIGTGSIGSFVTLSLAKMGFNNLYLFDPDKVEEHNFPNQFFREKDLGKEKVIAVKEIVKEFTGIEVKAMPIKFINQHLKGIVIAAVDSMETRKKIYDRCLKNKVRFLIDPRSGAEILRLYAIDLRNEEERRYYEQFFYPDNNTEQVPCTASNIIYTVLFVSALICSQIKKFVMNQDYKKETLADLTTTFVISL